MSRVASENTSRRRRQGGRGRPFPPGKIPRGARPWKRGESGNPGGRPRVAAFHKRCRELARGLLEVLGTMPVDLPGFVKAFEAIADRGGYVSADKAASFAVAIAQLPNLGDEQKREVISRWMKVYRDDEPAQSEASPPLPKAQP